MAKKKSQFLKGDWIVHLHYGVGKIKSIERKVIGDLKTSYYRVEAANSTFWVPVDDPDKERVRSVASKYKMRQAINILKESAMTLADDHNDRKRQINEAMSQISLAAGAEMLRDLASRQAEFKLNPSEAKALDRFTDKFILEWSVSSDTDIEKIREKFHELIQGIQAKVR